MIELTEVIVAFSGGKDSLAALDVCAKKFKRIEAYFMYTIEGLEFQETVLRWAESKYGIKILRVPHFELFTTTDDQALTWYRPSQKDIPKIAPRDLEDYIRQRFGISWIAGGEKKNDSLERRAMISAAGSFDLKRKRFYAIASWTDTQVYKYLRSQRIPLPGVYSVLGHSWRGMRGDELSKLAKAYPADYKKIVAVFPFAEAIRRRHEFYGTEKRARSPKKVGVPEV